jgi:hypothetical protein
MDVKNSGKVSHFYTTKHFCRAKTVLLTQQKMLPACTTKIRFWILLTSLVNVPERKIRYLNAKF